MTWMLDTFWPYLCQAGNEYESSTIKKSYPAEFSGLVKFTLSSVEYKMKSLA